MMKIKKFNVASPEVKVNTSLKVVTLAPPKPEPVQNKAWHATLTTFSIMALVGNAETEAN